MLFLNMVCLTVALAFDAVEVLALCDGDGADSVRPEIKPFHQNWCCGLMPMIRQTLNG
jgi:hypothetical protein